MHRAAPIDPAIEAPAADQPLAECLRVVARALHVGGVDVVGDLHEQRVTLHGAARDRGRRQLVHGAHGDPRDQ